MSGSLSSNTNYLVTVSRGTPSGTGITNGLSVMANATAKLRIAIENRWVNVLEALGISPDGSGLGSAVTNAVQVFNGANLLPVLATSHVWRGSSGIELTLDMRFDAWSDSVADVLTPVKTLIAMFSPTRGSGSGAVGALSSFLASTLGAGAAGAVGNQFLTPPGPTPWSYIKSGGNDPMAITVLLGQVMKITNLIPTNLAWEFENRFDSSGNPVCALVTATFISYTIPALDDVLGFFVNTTGNTALEQAAGGTTASNAATSNSNVPAVSTPYGSFTGYTGS